MAFYRECGEKRFRPVMRNDRGLDEKREWRVGQGKVAVGHLTEGNAFRGVEDVAEIEEHRDVRVPPEHHARGRGKKRRSREPVAQRPARGELLWIRFWFVRAALLTIRDDSNRPSRARNIAP